MFHILIRTWSSWQDLGIGCIPLQNSLCCWAFGIFSGVFEWVTVCKKSIWNREACKHIFITDCVLLGAGGHGNRGRYKWLGLPEVFLLYLACSVASLPINKYRWTGLYLLQCTAFPHVSHAASGADPAPRSNSIFSLLQISSTLSRTSMFDRILLTAPNTSFHIG